MGLFNRIDFKLLKDTSGIFFASPCSQHILQVMLIIIGNFMKNLRKFILSVSLTVVSGSATMAANPWTDCGIGRMIFDDADDKGWASSSNIIWDLGTTAVTSATLSEDACSASLIETTRYIQIAYFNLEEETVARSGTHLDGLLFTAGCEVGKSDNLKKRISEDFSHKLSEKDYNNKDPQLKRLEYFRILEKAAIDNPEAECKVIS